MNILTLGSEALVQKAAPVRVIGPAYKTLAARMLERMARSKGVGLAGPQIGLLERVFVLRAPDGVNRVFINPTITGITEERVTIEEGCLSLPGVYAGVSRPRALALQAWDENGKPFRLEADGMLARIIQHEYDHLEGILFIERLPEAQKTRLLARYEKGARRGRAGPR